MSAAPGWYPAPDDTFRMRWWDGANWAEFYEIPAGTDATRLASRRRPARAPSRSRESAAGRFGRAFWSAAAIAFVTLVAGVASGGFAGLLVAAGLVTLVATGYSMTTARPGWLPIPNRRTAAAIIGASLVCVIVGGSLAGAKDDAGTPHAERVPVQEGADTPEEPARQFAFTDESAPDPVDIVVATELPSVVVIDTSVTEADARDLLNTLVVRDRDSNTGYARTQHFGAAWIDVDANGCDTRNDILQRDLNNTVLSGTCRVLSGTFTSPYSGEDMVFARGAETSPDVQIDHVVSLSNAWQTGAQHLTQGQRVALANDPINLFAVDAQSNAEKGSADAAGWLPTAEPFQCEYVSHQVSVKTTYGLWVTSAEKRAMAEVLDDCRREPAISSSFAPRLIAEQAAIPFAAVTVIDPTLSVGTSVVSVAGSAGTRTTTFRVTVVNGVETSRVLVGEEVSRAAVDQITLVAPPPVVVPPPVAAPPLSCDPNYAGQCVPISSDVDCEGGSGNGPAYTRGPVTVVGSDIYDLDRDGDGIACD